MKLFIALWLLVITILVARLAADSFTEFERQQMPGVEPLMVTSHSQEDVYNEHMLMNCLIQLKDLKGGVSDVK